METQTEDAIVPVTSIKDLSRDLLAQVLCHVPLDVRLHDCAIVNTTWHTAALAATSNVRAVKLKKKEQLAALAPWLLRYGTAAKVCQVEVELGSIAETDAVSPSAALGEALGSLNEQLTSLQLSGRFQASAVAQLTSLHKLQDLAVQGNSSILHPTVTALPNTLTSLRLHERGSIRSEDDPSVPVPLAQLSSSLRRLELQTWTVCASLEAVAQLPQLRTCILSPTCSATAAAAAAAGGGGGGGSSDPQLSGCGLAALTALTALEHLDLNAWMRPDLEHTAAVTAADCAADCAALTAVSSRLTFLGLSEWQLPPELCSAVFPPAGQQLLPSLRELHLGPSFLHAPAATAAVVSCCPHLTRLHVAAAGAAGGVDSPGILPHEDHQQAVYRLVRLQGLEQLQQLQQLSCPWVQIDDPDVWAVLAQLTKLRSLDICYIDIPCLPGILELTCLRQLTRLEIEVAYFSAEGCIGAVCGWMGDATFGHIGLSAAVMRCALQLLEDTVQEDVLHALLPLVEAAPEACAAAVSALLATLQAVKVDRLQRLVTMLLTVNATVSGQAVECEEVFARHVALIDRLLLSSLGGCQSMQQHIPEHAETAATATAAEAASQQQLMLQQVRCLEESSQDQFNRLLSEQQKAGRCADNHFAVMSSVDELMSQQVKQLVALLSKLRRRARQLCRHLQQQQKRPQTVMYLLFARRLDFAPAEEEREEEAAEQGDAI